MTPLYRTNGSPTAVFDTAGRRVFGGGATPGEDTTDWTVLQHVATNSAWWRGSAEAPGSGGLIVVRHEIRSPAKALRATWGQFPAASTLIHKNLIYQGRASLLIDDVPYRLTFDGDTAVTIPYGETVTSDPLPDSVTVHPGSIVHSVWEADPGSMLVTGQMGASALASRRAAGTWDGTAGTMTSGTLSGGAITLAGLAPKERPARSVIVLGDSFLEQGWGRGACEAVGVAWSDMSQWLEQTPTDREQIANRIGADGPIPYDVIVTAYGGNNSSQTLAQQQAIHIASWRMLASLGAQVAAMTLHPYTDSTDRWATVEGQTHRVIAETDDGHTTREPARTARNDWMRDGAPLNTTTWEPYPTGSDDPAAVRTGEPGHPLALPAFDQADACETTRNSGIWKVTGGAWPVDGAHLTAHGSAMLQPYLEAWLAEHVA